MRTPSGQVDAVPIGVVQHRCGRGARRGVAHLQRLLRGVAVVVVVVWVLVVVVAVLGVGVGRVVVVCRPGMGGREGPGGPQRPGGGQPRLGGVRVLRRAGGVRRVAVRRPGGWVPAGRPRTSNHPG